ncbi:hypothetical protein CRM22_010592 [Opisthorchis felineus]|uniref:Bridge-like lipid transfer protein family member 1 C-terminal domain-containing protein n=1 Tax=Opisthorchis felineus TaxID=147828 RepID=A0A4S2L2S6_OPIFE|nr:hypothetical protein CRM22_010592 [Opisthorchis felineus]
MATRDVFRGEFDFKSNESLDTQITESIDRGDFPVAILSLVMLIVWSIYLLFYNSRVVGILISLLARRFVKHGFIRFGSVSFSALGGKLMLRDFAYMTDDYTLRCCYAIVVFNYWLRFTSSTVARDPRGGGRCLYIYLYGLDIHMYNRTAAYEELGKLFKVVSKSNRGSLQRQWTDSGSTKGIPSSTSRSRLSEADTLDNDDVITKPNGNASTGFLDLFWSHARRLVPVVKFNMELTKICAGNHLLPRACMLSSTRLTGTYSLGEPTYQADRYQHRVSAEFSNLLCTLIPVVEYAGQHAIEEPPKNWDRTFHVFHFGRGSFTYIQDEPGFVSNEPDQVYMSGGDVTVRQTWPVWRFVICVTKSCQLHYGPWADRQRDLLWHFFFPPSYQPAKVSDSPVTGQYRVPKKLVVEINFATNLELELLFSHQNVVKTLRLSALPDSSVRLNIPWLVGIDGVRTRIRISLVQGGIAAQHLWSDVLRTRQLDLDLLMHYPREWNMPQTWDFDLRAKCPQFTMLFDYKRFFKGLIEDWLRGSQPDLLHFVPCTYKFRISADGLNFVLLANDYNWVSSTTENAHIAFAGKRFSLSFDLPFVDYLPDVVPIVFAIEINSAKVRFSLPETNSSLHIIRDQHSRLKLVDRSGHLLKANPFEVYEELIPGQLDGDKPAHRIWFDCGRAPFVTLRIAFTYHPSPWVAEYWRFLPPHLRPEIPVVKLSGRSRHRRKGRKRPHTATTFELASDSSSQSELEELALGGLRPEGSRTQGPTEDQLLQDDFDASYLAPDTVDVHLHLANAQLCFYGILLRLFIHLKENYFGYYQTPVDFNKDPISGTDYLNSTTYPSDYAVSTWNGLSEGQKRSKIQRIVDPREHRPLMVRLSLEFHNILAHLPMHVSSFSAPCPTAFLDCIGFEMDKRWHETKIQLVFSPILLCVYDQCKASRPKSCSSLSTGCVQLMGLCLRGQGMFSHATLPLSAETLEYAWLLELIVGRFTGQLTAPQLTTIVQALNGFMFSVMDSENKLVCSRDFELCQHARPQSLCPFWPSVSSDTLCPGETLLKYRFLRVSLDGVDVGVVETGSCLSLQLDPVRLTNCNMHGTAKCSGLLIMLPRVRLVQYIRPMAHEHRTEARAPGSVTSPATVIGPTDPQSLWLEAGSLAFGPVHANVSSAPERSEHALWQLAFLKCHDAATKRLWFLWSTSESRFGPMSCAMSSGSASSYTPPAIFPNCGCFGQCSFFGSNESGRALFTELLTGDFQQRAVFPSRNEYKPHLFATSKATKQAGSSTGPNTVFPPIVYSTAEDNSPKSALPATRFGESLLVAHRLLHELHNPSFCHERSNGLLLMRGEVLATCDATKCADEDECCNSSDPSDEDFSTSESSNRPSRTSSPDHHIVNPKVRSGYLRARKRYHLASGRMRRDRNSSGSLSEPSSMSELLVPPDSPDEDDLVAGVHHTSTGAGVAEAPMGPGLVNRLPSGLSLNSLIGPLTPSESPSQSSQLALDELSFPDGASTRPTPPPRRFTKPGGERDGDILRPPLLGPPDVPKTGNVEEKTFEEDTFEKFVDLRGQLNRPITESGLLRAAYSHHLNVYRCITAWAKPVRLSRRWHLCKHTYQSVESLKDCLNPPNAELDKLTNLHPWEYRLGSALAPRFQIVQSGFSPQLILSRAAGKTSTSDTKSATMDPQAKGDVSLAHVSSNADAVVWLQNTVDFLVSPLFTEAMERYLNVLSPVLSSTPPSVVIDGMHNKCVKVKLAAFKHVSQSLGRSDRNTESKHASPNKLNAFLSSESPEHFGDVTMEPSSPYWHSSIFHLSPQRRMTVDNTSSRRQETSDIRTETGLCDTDVSKSHRKASTLEDLHCTSATDSEGPNKDQTDSQQHERRFSVPTRTDLRTRGDTIVSGKLAALSVERINFCFLQLYAVEDLVHLDSLRSGLHDLTCVSLLALCVDSVSFELMKCCRTEAAASRMVQVEPCVAQSDMSSEGSELCNQPLLKQSQETGRSVAWESHKRTERFRRIQPSTADERSTPASDRMVSCPSLQELDEVDSSLDAPPSFVRNRLNQHSRQPSAPPILNSFNSPLISVPQPASINSHSLKTRTHEARDEILLRRNPVQPGTRFFPHVITDDESRTVPTLDVAAGLSDNPNWIRGSEIVCQLKIRRIHGQLRRLTRLSQFNAGVLLTAIPFESSRTFFVFESDEEFHSSLIRAAGTPRASAVLNEQSTGWIMFECGLENLSLACNRRDGYGDLSTDPKVEQHQTTVLSSGEKNSSTVKPVSKAATKVAPAAEAVFARNTSGRQSGRKRVSVQFPLPAQREFVSNASASDEPQNDFSPQPHPDVPDSVASPAGVSPPVQRNGLLSRLHVATVWLNFPTPKRLPNKRRIELLRSDWNLLSTTTPSIKAWMDPCNRLISVCQQLYGNAERRILAVTTCLMTEAINYKLPTENGLFIFQCFGNESLSAYARRRAPSARAIHFDPSCQLFVVLRQYLNTLTAQYGVLETDRLLSEWLKDNVVPPNDLLQCGILSLTREWRSLVELLAVLAQDLQNADRLSPSLGSYVVPAKKADHGVGRVDKQTADLSGVHELVTKTLKTTGLSDRKFVPPSIVPKVGFVSGSVATDAASHLLRMATTPLSPIPGRYLSPKVDAKADVQCFVNEQYVDDQPPPSPQTHPLISGEGVGFKMTSDEYRNNTTSLDDAGKEIQNPILRRFLHDAKIPLSAAQQPPNISQGHFATVAVRDTPQTRMEVPLTDTVIRRASDPALRSAPVVSAVGPLQLVDETIEQEDRPKSRKASRHVRTTLCRNESSQPAIAHHGDYKLTTEDFEHVAHLNAQFQQVAYIQRFFSPLLESVGLSAKGIRRTTLMKKFGGFFSAEGLLQTFQIEIVLSVRNPLATRVPPSSATGSAPSASTMGAPSWRTPVGMPPTRKSTFLCRNFGSKLTFRDVVDLSGRKGHSMDSSSQKLDITLTTTKLDVISNIESLRLHINLPLLRLVHQFVTMIYYARDTHKTLEAGRPKRHTTSPVGMQLPQKPDSKGSSDGTEGTLRSRSSGYVRLGEGSVESGGHGNSSTDVPIPIHAFIEPFPEQHSSEVASSSSVEKDSHKGSLPTTTPTGYQLTISDSIAKPTFVGIRPTAAELPACWRRLLNYVDLYTTVPKTKTVMRKPPSTMPTITEDDPDVRSLPAGRSRAGFEGNTASSQEASTPPGVVTMKPMLLGRRLLSTVSYQPLNEDIEMGHIPTSTMATRPSEVLQISTRPAAPPLSTDQVSSTGVSPGLFTSEDGAPKPTAPSSLRFTKEPLISSTAMEQLTLPWVCSERMPLKIFVSTKIQKMDVSAVLSELNLFAGIGDVHGSMTHSTRIRGRGYFADQVSEQCFLIHCGEGQLQLLERLASQHIQQVVRMKSGRSFSMISCRRSRQTERNACVLSVGHVTITLPHHPVRLHGVMQRQAKRITSSVNELLRSSPAPRNQLHPRSIPEVSTSSASRAVPTPTTGSTTTTTASDAASQLRTNRLSTAPTEGPTAMATATAMVKPSNPPLVFSLTAVAQGLTVNVALHPTLAAVYNMNPVYFIGFLGPRGYVDIDLSEHSISLKSMCPPENFPHSIKIALPRVSTTVIRRKSSGGQYSRGERKQPILTRGLTAEQGMYVHVQVKIGALEQTLTTDLLNYIVVVFKLFMKEINEVLQKMAGDEQQPMESRSRLSVFARGPSTKPPGPSNNWLLSRAARGSVKFTVRIRMEEIQLMATTSSDAIKLEAKAIDLELTNRVSQAPLDPCIPTRIPTDNAVGSQGKSAIAPTRPSNLKLQSSIHPADQSASPNTHCPRESLFLYATVGSVCAELGYLEQDVFYNERSPESKTVAFFKTNIALRSLLADEKPSALTESNVPDVQSLLHGGEYDAFLISLNRPILWIKPFSVDRALLIWMVYKKELAKWKGHIDYLSSMAPVDPSSVSQRSGKLSPTGIRSPGKRVASTMDSIPATPPRIDESVFGVDAESPPTPNLVDPIPGTSSSKVTPDNVQPSTLFLQLNVTDLGLCLPISILQSNVPSMEVGSRTALVLTLDQSRISACYRDSLVSQGKFTDFCLRFDDDFNVWSDEWKPDWKRASISVRGKQHTLILNACVVPSGTFNVCWRDLERRAQWHLLICWQMRGLDFHLDDNVGRRLKALFSILTRITGYDGAAPLLPTSAEEEEEDIIVDSSVHREPAGSIGTDKPSMHDGSVGTLGKDADVATGSDRTQRTLGAYSDIASLDRYRPDSFRTEYITSDPRFPDLSQVRSMEFHKHQQELLEAQYCQAFKRQKWNTLRRKKVSSGQPRSPLFAQPSAPTSVGSGAAPLPNGGSQTNTFFMGDSDLRSDVVGFSAPNGHRGSVVSRDESVYFDADTDEGVESTSVTHTDQPSVYETVTGELSHASSGANNLPPEKGPDLWFDPMDAAGTTDSVIFPTIFDTEDFVTGEEQVDSDSPSSDEAEETIQQLADADRTMSPNQAPPPPPRMRFPGPPAPSHIDRNWAFRRETDLPPKVLLKVDVQIHIDSGCCVLHPRLPQDSLTKLDEGFRGAEALNLPSHEPSFQTPDTSASRQPTAFTARSLGFSNNNLLSHYLERYKRHLLQDQHYLSSDLIILFLPALDVKLHYNSMTEVDLFSATPSTALRPSGRHLTSPVQPTPSVSRQASTHENLYRRSVEKARTIATESDSGILTSHADTVDSGLVKSSGTGTSGLKKQADLYVSCFLQKLPNELILHPALLDFLEQALENIPIPGEVDSVTSDDSNTVNGERKVSASSSASADGLMWETFPLHAIVHLQIQPLTLRLLCVPTSRMQCLMSLPLLDVVFSTKRDQTEQVSTDPADPKTSNQTSVARRTEQETTASRHQAANSSPRGPIQVAIQANGSGATLRLPANPSPGDVVTGGGLCVTAMLKDFRITVFHPYVDSKSARSEPVWGTAWSGDSLTLFVQDIQLNISRMVETTLVQLTTAPTRPDEIAEPTSTDISRSSPPNTSAHRYTTVSSFSTLQFFVSDAWGLHRDFRFSSIIDIGAAVFTCDTRRTLEILDIPKAWFRSSLARRLIFGNECATGETLNQSADISETVQCARDVVPPDATRVVREGGPSSKETSALVESVQPEDERPSIRSFSAAPRYSQDDSSDQPVSPAGERKTQRPDDHAKCKRRSTLLKTAWAPGTLDSVPLHFMPGMVKTSSTARRKTGDTSVGPAEFVSATATLATDRAPGASPVGSLKVASWHALPMFCVNLKRLDLSLFIGSAMGQTRLVMEKMFCDGRFSIHSTGRKNAMLSGGLSTCQFTSEGGGVGGELCLLNAEARIRSDDNPTRDPQHSLESRIGGFQLRIEYMNTNILLMRVNALSLKLQDEWKLKDAAKKFVECKLTTLTGSTGGNFQTARVPSLRSTFLEEQVSTETDVGAPPVYIRVVGEVNWDQAQTAIVRTTTPDLLRSISKVREYFEEQVREGRLSLIGQSGTFDLFSQFPRGPSVPGQGQLDQEENALVDRLLQRHWQRLLYSSLKIYIREQISASPDSKLADQVQIFNQLMSSLDQTYPVLGGSMQLSGRSLGLACFAGSFRSAPDWAIFNIQYPTACFETEAQREPPAQDVSLTDPSEQDGWVNVRQVLSFDLGSHPEFQPQMAYVLRVRRGSQPTTRNPPVLTISEWMEFTFHGADNTVVSFVRSTDPSSVRGVVQLSQFPVQFPSPIPATGPHMFTESPKTPEKNITRETAELRSSASVPTWTGLIGSPQHLAPTPSTTDSTVGRQLHVSNERSPAPPPRPNPLRPPTEGEILFVLPSISLRITTDQRQTMVQPTLSSLPPVKVEVVTESPPDPSGEAPSTTKPVVPVSKGARSWIYRYRTGSNSDSTSRYQNKAEKVSTESSTSRPTGFAPTVKISFQTDFHGFVQLGLIDVPWLPTLISSYLNERLQDYELSTVAPPPSMGPGTFIDRAIAASKTELTNRLRALSTTSSPLVQDARSYEIVHWSLSPVCRWLLASNIGVPAFDRLLESVGFRKARVTIPKWLQRGVMDHLDNATSVLLRGSLELAARDIEQISTLGESTLPPSKLTSQKESVEQPSVPDSSRPTFKIDEF